MCNLNASGSLVLLELAVWGLLCVFLVSSPSCRRFLGVPPAHSFSNPVRTGSRQQQPSEVL